jgi:hypothetical protein
MCDLPIRLLHLPAIQGSRRYINAVIYLAQNSSYPSHGSIKRKDLGHYTMKLSLVPSGMWSIIYNYTLYK